MFYRNPHSKWNGGYNHTFEKLEKKIKEVSELAESNSELFKKNSENYAESLAVIRARRDSNH